MSDDKAPRDLTLPEFGIVVDAPDYKALLRENEALRAELLIVKNRLKEILGLAVIEAPETWTHVEIEDTLDDLDKFLEGK